MKRIRLIITYFGHLPQCLELFLAQCQSSLLDIVFVSDLDFSAYEFPENVSVHFMKMDEIAARIKNLTEISPRLTYPYKLCDFKPFYASIFPELVKDYPYWAFGDCDLIYGDIDSFLQPLLDEDYDMLSFRKYWTTGAFNICKNTPKVNDAWKSLSPEELCKLLTDEQIYCYDEAGGFYHELEEGTEIKDLPTKTQTLTHFAVYSGIRWYHEDLICEDEESPLLKVEKGHITDLKTGKEVFAFHYVVHKKRFIFSLPVWHTVPSIYYIDASGFFIEPNIFRSLRTFLARFQYEAFARTRQLYRIIRYRRWFYK